VTNFVEANEIHGSLPQQVQVVSVEQNSVMVGPRISKPVGLILPNSEQPNLVLKINVVQADQTKVVPFEQTFNLSSDPDPMGGIAYTTRVVRKTRGKRH
jgi:hypothetical protein